MRVDESVHCWQDHFCQVLNVQSRCVENSFICANNGSRSEKNYVSIYPSKDEIFAAMSSLMGSKAEGENGVLPDMLQCCGANLLKHLVKIYTKSRGMKVSLKRGRIL